MGGFGHDEEQAQTPHFWEVVSYKPRYLRAAYIGVLTTQRFKLTNQMYYRVSLTSIPGSNFGNSEVITAGPLTYRPSANTGENANEPSYDFGSN